MTSTPTRMPIWRPASPHPLGSLAPMVARARDTEPTIVMSADGVETAGQAASTGDSGPAAGDVRGAGGGTARGPGRRAGQDRALPAHQRPQPRPRLRGAAGALSDLGGSARRA